MKKLIILNKIIIFITILTSISYSLKSIMEFNLYNALIRLSIILIIFIPNILEKIFKIKISEASKMIYVIFIFLAHFLGSIINFYNTVSGYDTFAHILSGILVFFLGLEFLINIKKYDKNNIYFNVLFIISLSFMIAGIWEIFEFTCDKLFSKDAQHVLTTGVNDTMKDMIVAVLGTSSMAIIYLFEQTNKLKLFITKFIEQVK